MVETHKHIRDIHGTIPLTPGQFALLERMMGRKNDKQAALQRMMPEALEKLFEWMRGWPDSGITLDDAHEHQMNPEPLRVTDVVRLAGKRVRWLTFTVPGVLQSDISHAKRVLELSSDTNLMLTALDFYGYAWKVNNPKKPPVPALPPPGDTQVANMRARPTTRRT